MKYETTKVGSILRRFATHHNHGEGWKYTRSTGDLEHIRYRHDHTGYDHWTKRWARGLNIDHLLARDGLSRGMHSYLKGEPLWKQVRGRVLSAVAWFRVSVRKDKNLPDGTINGNLIHWEEDGEYIECVGPTVGVKIADFLEQEPNHPHAIAIAAEINRIWALPAEQGKHNEYLLSREVGQ